MNAYIIINILSLIFSCIGMIISVIFLVFICIRIRPLKSNIPLILICNTYLTEMTLFIITIEACSRTIFGLLNPSISYEGVYCQIRAYFLHVAAGNVIYSFVVQGLFRLFRVVFYQNRSLRTLSVFIIAIIIQWVFVCLIHLTFFIFNDFEYFPGEYRCEIAYPNTRGSIMVFLFAYIIPTNGLCTIYFFIIRYVRQTNQAMQNRQFSRKRDLVIFKRLVGFFIILQLLSTPLAVIWLIYIITGYLISLVYQLQILSLTFSHIFITIFITLEIPQIQEKLRRRPENRVHPLSRGRFQANQILQRIQVQRF